jgi:hypothetical protein
MYVWVQMRVVASSGSQTLVREAGVFFFSCASVAWRSDSKAPMLYHVDATRGCMYGVVLRFERRLRAS